MLTLILSSLTALACSPTGPDAEILFPAADASVSADVAPLIVIEQYTEGDVEIVLSDSTGQIIEGSREITPIHRDLPGSAVLVRFVPTAPLAAGDYTLSLTHSETAVIFPTAHLTVDDTPACAPRGLSLGSVISDDARRDESECGVEEWVPVEAWIGAESGELTCEGERAGTVAILTDSLEQPLEDGRAILLRLGELEEDESNLFELAGAVGQAEQCLTLVSLGEGPSHDVVSETVCATPIEELHWECGTGSPLSCSVVATQAPLGVIGLGGLLALFRRRRTI